MKISHSTDYVDQWFVYPGHPAVMAYNIMCVYDSYSAAIETTQHGFSSALGHCDVLGSGGEVHQGIAFLKAIKQGETKESVFDRFSDQWRSYGAGGHLDAVKPGQEKADKVKSILFEAIDNWDFS